MTTPTKEQIEKIKKKIIKDRIKLLKSCGFTPIEIGRRIEVSDVEDDIRTAITEWEKMKDAEVRGKKLYKLGTEDWLNFNKAIE